MNDEDIERIRNEKLKKRAEETRKKAEYEERVKSALRQILEDSAYERMMNVKISNEEVYFRAASALVRAAQSGDITGKVSDGQMQMILGKMLQRRDPTIEIKRK